MSTAFILFIILIALSFDYTNGMHDAANSIATIVSTRVLTPQRAVIWAAFFNFIAFLFFGLHVARTIGKGIVDPTTVTISVITAALLGAIIWDLLTWWWGIPSSSSHALVGGLAGAAVVHAGWGVLIKSGLIKIAAFIVISPLLGALIGFFGMIGIYWTVRRASPARVGKTFRRLQSTYGFTIVDGMRPTEATNADLRKKISALLAGK